MLKGAAVAKYKSIRSGEFYFIVYIDDTLTCTCKGYTFRKHCKHITHFNSEHNVTIIRNPLIEKKKILNAPADFYTEEVVGESNTIPGIVYPEFNPETEQANREALPIITEL